MIAIAQNSEQNAFANSPKANHIMNSHQTPASQAGQGHGNTPTCLPRKWGRVIKSITFAIQPDIREQVELLARQRNVSMSIVLNDLLHVALESDTGLLDGLNAPSHTMLASQAPHGTWRGELLLFTTPGDLGLAANNHGHVRLIDIVTWKYLPHSAGHVYTRLLQRGFRIIARGRRWCVLNCRQGVVRRQAELPNGNRSLQFFLRAECAVIQ
ncbi:hypothetical protein LHK_02613 [Laribacter hongkongensis HLHK9]|uniref:Uncharacterized protein n=1 Tax=Laribacter hongkongensis (strain HLHK9) TaxID=557598 RepID=C1DCH5_LARHH|nr:hypothetical protein [Laribacter hongkongensis]ACO75594.1 hypothetical protein LHK_02613 [Laribacter hongkongensis HLHK9]